MNALNFLTKFYALQHNYPCIPFWVLTPLRRMTRFAARIILPRYLKRPFKSENQRTEENLIVSLTSFPARIEVVWQVISCVLRQSVLPEKIILWLSKEQFQSEEAIPNSLKNLLCEKFEIRLVENDVRSHKKYLYAFEEFPEKKVILIDDDIYYPDDMIEKMLSEHRKNPQAVICRFGGIAKFDENSEILPYNSWWFEENGRTENQNFFFGSGGGTLLIPNLLYKDVLNIGLAKKLTPIADDIWLNAMVNLNNLTKIKIKFGIPLPIFIKENKKLCTVNVGENMNDVQIKDISRYYLEKIDKNPFAKKG